MVERVRVNKARTSSSITRVTGYQMPALSPMKEMGHSGTAVYAGFIQTKEKSAEWVGRSRWITISEILANVSIVAAGLRHFLNLISRPAWSVIPASDSDAESVMYAEFVEDVLHDMETPLSRVVKRAANYQFVGFGVHEWTAKRREDGHIGFQDIEPRPQYTIERWEIDENTGKVDGVWQRSPQNNKLLGLPRSKILYLVEDTFTDSPEGLGMARNLAEPYNRLKQFLELEARTFERDLRGIPIGRIPLTKLREAVAANKISKEKAEELISAMQNFVELQVKQSDTGVMLDSQPYESVAADGPKVSNVMQWGLDLLQGSANGLQELSNAIDRLQREMARVLGTEHLMMGDQGGNRALSMDKSRNLYLMANSVLGTIVDGFEKDVVDPLWMLNAYPDDKKPSLIAEDVSFKDIELITSSLKDMAAAGAILDPNDPAIDDVRDFLGISRPGERNDVMPDSMETDNELETETTKRNRSRVRVNGHIH